MRDGFVCMCSRGGGIVNVGDWKMMVYVVDAVGGHAVHVARSLVPSRRRLCRRPSFVVSFCRVCSSWRSVWQFVRRDRHPTSWMGWIPFCGLI